MLVIPAVGKLKQENCYEFKTSLGYRMRLYLKKTSKNIIGFKIHLFCHPMAPYHLWPVGELTLPLTGCSAQESEPCTCLDNTPELTLLWGRPQMSQP